MSYKWLNENISINRTFWNIVYDMFIDILREILYDPQQMGFLITFD